MTAPLQDISMSPVALGQGFGLLHRGAGAGGVGVVLCSAWGIHELSSRKLLFRLATRLAIAGLPALRFDYPGTADAIGVPADGFSAWLRAATDAADALKASGGVGKVIFAGIGIGATVAMLAAAGRDDVAGLVLMAPVVGGRRYIREIALGAPVVEEALGLGPAQRPEGVSIGGIVMPPGVARDLKTLDLMSADAGKPVAALVVARPNQPQDADLAGRLHGLGWHVDRAPFDGYDEAMDNPTIAVMPDAVIEAATRWCRDIAMKEGGSTMPAPLANPVRVDVAGIIEEPLTFDRGLFGILTLPERRVGAALVVFVNSGYDHHAGWAYQWARAARSLAASGIPSLRFDMANIGDSAPKPDARDQVLYGNGQQADIVSALDMLAARGESRIVLVGRCSGAFAALHVAARDDRVATAVLINPLRMVWDPDEDVDVAIRVGPRSMADYRQRALSGRTFRRLIAGDIDIAGAARGLATQFTRRIVQRISPFLGPLSKTTRLRRQCHGMMENISRRGAGTRFVCSERDASLEQVAFYFGGDHRGLDRFDGASLTLVPDADHNMTPEPAHSTVVDVIRDSALRSSVTVRKNRNGSVDRSTEPLSGIIDSLRA